MTTENLYNALEICLTALEKGADIESCLARFPALAGELRPILETAVQARASAVEEVPADVLRRGKARVLQAAAELREREQRQKRILPFWRRSASPGRTFRLAFTALAMLVFLLTGGTGLVNASSGSLPGDNLYPVKLGWEDMRLFLTFDSKARQHLENEYEQERVHEIDQLMGESRMEKVNFRGVVQNQQAEVWVVDGVSIKISHDTAVSPGVAAGAYVEIEGETSDGRIEAKRVTLLATPIAPLSPVPSATMPAQQDEKPSATPERFNTPQSEKTPESEKPESSLNDNFGATQAPEAGDTPVITLGATATPRLSISNSGGDETSGSGSDSGSNSGGDGTSGSGSDSGSNSNDDHGGGSHNSDNSNSGH